VILIGGVITAGMADSEFDIDIGWTESVAKVDNEESAFMVWSSDDDDDDEEDEGED